MMEEGNSEMVFKPCVLLCVVCLGVLCDSVVRSASAAPTVSYLYPAGAKQGTTVEVTASGTFEKWPVEVWVSGQGVTARAGKDKGKISFTVAADAIPGTYWVRFHDVTGASGLRPFIVGTLPEVTEKEPNDEPGKAQPITLPAVVNGVLAKSGDVDGYTVTLRKGQTLVAAVEANHTLRSPIDAVIQIATPDGFVLDQGNDHAGLDPLVSFQATKDGPHVVRVFAFPSQPDSSIRFTGSDASVYRLTLTTEGYADHAWPLAVSRDKPGTVALIGWNIPETARALPVTTVKDKGTARVTHAQIANPVSVAVEPHPCWLATDAMKQSDALKPPFTISGRMGKANQVDQFRVLAKKGQPLTVRCESPSLGLAVSPVMSFRTLEGKSLTRAEPGQPNTDASMTVTPPADGIFTLEVRDLFGSHGMRHAYRLTVQPPQPDFSLTVASDRITCVAGTPSDIVVTVARRDGFSGEVKLTVDGLPGGLSATVAPATGKPDPNKLTLRFAAEKTYKQGPVRIVGTAAGQKRTAAAALSDFGNSTEDLWLSPGAAPPASKKKRR